jgi:hypothetical protein
MADTKISTLPASTTPLAGTEVLPIVQSSTTKQVSVANLTAGRAISAASVTATTGNFVVGTSGQGIDFSATPGTGTSELLADYEEGTWTPSIGGTATYTLQSGTYTKVGRLVSVSAVLQINVIGTGNVNTISGLPFARDANSMQAPGSMTFISAISSTVSMLVPVVQISASTVIFQGLTVVGNTTSQINVFQNGARVDFQITYQT